MTQRAFLAVLTCAAALAAVSCTSYVQLPFKPGNPAPAGSPTGGGLIGLQPTAAIVPAVDTSVAPPLCAAAASCAALDAEQIPLQCVKKVPYTNVLVPRGTTFEVVDPSGEFSCADSGVVVNGKEVLTCHGKELYAFQLKLSNPACGASSLPTDRGQCQPGYGYDVGQNCCMPVGGDADGSTVVTVNLGACPLPQP
ncbi:MAG: hypothetical protein ACM3MF_06710 [Anaerolineae bacterium]